MPGWPKHRLWLSQAGNTYSAAVLGVGLKDITAGFRGTEPTSSARIGLDHVHSQGYGFQVEMAYKVLRGGGAVVEVPITFRDRVRGTRRCRSGSSARPCAR